MLLDPAYGQKKDARTSRYSEKGFYNKRQSAPGLLQEAAELVHTDPTSALNKVQDALAMSIANNDTFNEGKCYLLLGEINENIEEWNLALENFTRARALFPNDTRTTEYRASLKGMGRADLSLGHYQDAIAAFTEAAGLSRGNERLECNLDVSEAYYRMGQYTKALEVLEEEETSSVQTEGRYWSKRRTRGLPTSAQRSMRA